MGLYMSVQKVRFRSAHDHNLFMNLLAGTPEHLKKIPGFRQFSWWNHPDDPLWFLEMHVWDDHEAMLVWMRDGFHKYLRAWGVQGYVVEDIVTNSIIEYSKLYRVCPLCGTGSVKQFEIEHEHSALEEPCGNCGQIFPLFEDNGSTMIYGSDAPIHREPHQHSIDEVKDNDNHAHV